MKKELVEKANRSSRTRGSVGKNAIVPRYVRETYADRKEIEILDFGAGKHAAHAQTLREAGFKVRAWEFGGNFDASLHNADALASTYDLVYASNVLNTQGDEEMLRETINQIADAVKDNGHLVANYPASPRYGGFTTDEIITALKARFREVTVLKGGKTAPLMLAIK